MGCMKQVEGTASVKTIPETPTASTQVPRTPGPTSIAEKQGLQLPVLDDSAHEDIPACKDQAMLLVTLPLEEVALEFFREVAENMTGASLNLMLSSSGESKKELSIDFR